MLTEPLRSTHDTTSTTSTTRTQHRPPTVNPQRMASPVTENEPLFAAVSPAPSPVAASPDTRGPPARDDRSRWMSTLRDSIADRTLGQIYMVGSHNAASYAIGPDSGISPDAPAAITKNANGFKKNLTLRVASTWSVCQEMDVKSQLEWGARYLDLRLAVRSLDKGSPAEVWISHGMYSVPLHEVITDIAAFLDAAPPEEVVIIDIQHIHGFHCDSHHDTVLEALKPLVPRMAHRPLGMHSPLRDFWEAKAQVLVAHCNSDMAARFEFLHVRARSIESLWHNRNDVGALVPDIKRTLREREEAAQGRTPAPDAAGRLHVTQGIITPAAHNIVKTVVAPWCCLSFKCIEDFAKSANDHVLRAWTEHDSTAHSPTAAAPVDGRNVLMLDFIHLGRCPKTGMDAFELCMHLNRRLPSAPPTPCAAAGPTAEDAVPETSSAPEPSISKRAAPAAAEQPEPEPAAAPAAVSAPASRPSSGNWKEKTL